MKEKDNKYYMAFYQVKGQQEKDMFLYMNKDFKRRYKSIESLEKDIKESIEKSQIRNVKKINIYSYIESKEKEINVIL